MKPTRVLMALTTFLASGLAAAPAKEKPVEPVCISGIYPHLAVFNGRYDSKTGTWHGTGGECGIGGVVPWAGKLWVMTYPQHDTRGGPDKLWTIDKDMKQEMRPESVGGTHAGRMIHRESNQLILGPYFIDVKGKVRAANVKTELVGRITAIARHLRDPANLVYVFDMEGAIYEVNVHSLAVKKLFEKPVPGWHGKGGYTGQGRFIIANNGERGYGGVAKHFQVGGPPKGPDERGCLAEWDGETWRIVERKQFLDVTGPGGLFGNPDGKAPVWSIGWDRRSCILKLLDGGAWSTFRLPKASHTFDPAHGWYTEWPRIREIGGGKWLICLHGMFYDFPPAFRTGKTGGIRPVASHLRYVPDFCDWDGRLVLAADEASTFGNPFCKRAQSNLWFGTLDGVRRFGPRAGWGGPWVGDAVKAGEPSDPFLIGGFETRCLHLATGGRPPAGEVLRTTGRFAVTELPDELAGLPLVTLARGDHTKPAPGYSFTVNQDVTVYLAADDRGKPDPGEGWTKTGLRLAWGDKYTDSVYTKAFKAGRVDIPGRSDAHNDAGHHAVPNACFLKADGKIEVTGLPENLNGQVAYPAAAPRPAATGAMTFTVEVDADGSGKWAPYKTLPVPASGYVHHLLPADLKAEWLRLRTDRDGPVTAFLHCSSPRVARDDDDDAIFAGLAKANATAGMRAGFVRPAHHNTRLQFLTADGRYWEVNETMAFHRPEPDRADEVRQICATKEEFTVDEASAIMTFKAKGKRYRLPKGDAAFDKPFAWGQPRCIREVQSERYLVNCHGTLYEMPRDTGVVEIKPVATHNRAIMDFCSWRGLLVLSGVRGDAKPDGNTFTSADGRAGLWFGAVDDLWRLGKPVGRGGPWKDTAVKAGVPSDPYLMTNYDRKTVELSHDADAEVAFTLEVDVDLTGVWRRYAVLNVPLGKTVRHVFPDGYGAHWVRVTADRACTATAWFLYE